MATIYADEFVGGKRVEAFIIDPTGKTESQIATEWQTLCDNKWPPASGFTRQVGISCAVAWPRWYLLKIMHMITDVTERCNDDGTLIITVTISQP